MQPNMKTLVAGWVYRVTPAEYHSRTSSPIREFHAASSLTAENRESMTRPAPRKAPYNTEFPIMRTAHPYISATQLYAPCRKRISPVPPNHRLPVIPFHAITNPSLQPHPCASSSPYIPHKYSIYSSLGFRRYGLKILCVHSTLCHPFVTRSKAKRFVTIHILVRRRTRSNPIVYKRFVTNHALELGTSNP